MIPQDWDWGGGSEYCWTEGNYSCDCNRALFFYNWGPESEDRKCGDEEFLLPRVILDDGTVIEIESLEAQQV